jgi:hypothetical protein
MVDDKKRKWRITSGQAVIYLFLIYIIGVGSGSESCAGIAPSNEKPYVMWHQIVRENSELSCNELYQLYLRDILQRWNGYSCTTKTAFANAINAAPLMGLSDLLPHACLNLDGTPNGVRTFGQVHQIEKKFVEGPPTILHAGAPDVKPTETAVPNAVHVNLGSTAMIGWVCTFDMTPTRYALPDLEDCAVIHEAPTIPVQIDVAEPTVMTESHKAYRCSATEMKTTRSKTWFTPCVSSWSPQIMVDLEERDCWNIIKAGTWEDVQIHMIGNLTKATNNVEPKCPSWGTNTYISRALVVTIGEIAYGSELVSTLGEVGGCDPSAGYCKTALGTMVWVGFSKDPVCKYQKASDRMTGLMSGNNIVTTDGRTGFSIKGAAEVIPCLGGAWVHTTSDLLVRVIENVTGNGNDVRSSAQVKNYAGSMLDLHKVLQWRKESTSMRRKLCEVSNSLLIKIRGEMTRHPTNGARALLRNGGVVARLNGPVLEVFQCSKAPYKYDSVASEVCYRQVRVLYGQAYEKVGYLDPITKDIFSSGEVVECQTNAVRCESECLGNNCDQVCRARDERVNVKQIAMTHAYTSSDASMFTGAHDPITSATKLLHGTEYELMGTIAYHRTNAMKKLLGSMQVSQDDTGRIIEAAGKAGADLIGGAGRYVGNELHGLGKGVGGVFSGLGDGIAKLLNPLVILGITVVIAILVAAGVYLCWPERKSKGEYVNIPMVEYSTRT